MADRIVETSNVGNPHNITHYEFETACKLSRYCEVKSELQMLLYCFLRTSLPQDRAEREPAFDSESYLFEELRIILFGSDRAKKVLEYIRRVEEDKKWSYGKKRPRTDSITTEESASDDVSTLHYIDHFFVIYYFTVYTKLTIRCHHVQMEHHKTKRATGMETPPPPTLARPGSVPLVSPLVRSQSSSSDTSFDVSPHEWLLVKQLVSYTTVRLTTLL
jgi:hypothetical protein